MNRLLIAGGRGFIGQAVINDALARGWQVDVISRSEAPLTQSGAAELYTWSEFDQLSPEKLQTYQAILNLAGANIGTHRWTTARKQTLLQSRIISTQRLAEHCARLGKDAPALFCASGVSIYGPQTPSPGQPLSVLDEESAINAHHQPVDFMSTLACAWEQATHSAREASVRVVNLRFGVVLGPGSPALTQLIRPFYFGLGGRLGSGQQPFSWVALPDVIRAIYFLLAHPELEGPINVVSPTLLTQAELAQAVAKHLHKPCRLKMPAWLLKLMLGEMAQGLLLQGQHVAPKRLLDTGFEFQYPELPGLLNLAVRH